MATTITAGNATNGIVITPDNTGILELKTGTGAGTTALTLNASQNATVAGTLTVGSTLQVAGVTTNIYPIVSGSAITLTNQTAPEFTSIPSWAKRITLMFQGVSTSGASDVLVQLGTGGTPTYATSGYLGASSSIASTSPATSSYTTGFGLRAGGASAAAAVRHGHVVITNTTGNTWVASGVIAYSDTTTMVYTGGSVALGAALTAVRLFIDGSQQFDAGTINIMWE